MNSTQKPATTFFSFTIKCLPSAIRKDIIICNIGSNLPKPEGIEKFLNLRTQEYFILYEYEFSSI